MTGNPMVSFNRAIATAMVDGPAAGLALLEPLAEPLAAIIASMPFAHRRSPTTGPRRAGRPASPSSITC
jgi:predicted RNA polymerase sigma factor